MGLAKQGTATGEWGGEEGAQGSGVEGHSWQGAGGVGGVFGVGAGGRQFARAARYRLRRLSAGEVLGGGSPPLGGGGGGGGRGGGEVLPGGGVRQALYASMGEGLLRGVAGWGEEEGESGPRGGSGPAPLTLAPLTASQARPGGRAGAGGGRFEPGCASTPLTSSPAVAGGQRVADLSAQLGKRTVTRLSFLHRDESDERADTSHIGSG